VKYLIERKKSKDGEVHVLMLPDWSSDPKEAIQDIRSLCKEMRTFVGDIDKQKPSFALLVEKTEDIEDRIEQVRAPLDNLYSSMRTPMIAEIYAEVEDLLAQLKMDVWSDLKFYRAHRAFRQMGAYRKLDKEEKIAFDLQLATFKNYGILLSPKRRMRIRMIEEEIAILEQRFQKNIDVSLNAFWNSRERQTDDA
jgi:Zn-dependent oligopeptidase